MSSAAASFDLATAFLGQPKTLAYGLVRGAGNLVFQQQFSDNSIVAFYMLGEGPWDALVRLWINDVAVALPNLSEVHFHNGLDGEIGFGMGLVSTGGDQHVDSYFAISGMPGTLSPITWSRYAYLALHYPPNPAAPSAGLTVLGDYQAMRCRIFDSSGNQTAFQWTQNPAWWICDFLIRKFILREAKANQPLVAAELARFDWPAWVAAANYFDATIPAGPARFSDGGLVFLQSGLNATNALEQMLLMCQSYLLDHNGKLSLYADQPRSSVFLATTDNVQPGSFIPSKTTLRTGKNRITATWREEAVASGSSDDGTRMAISTRQFDHVAHQMAIGARGPGLSVMPSINELQLDFGINTSERVSRLCSFRLLRDFGLDVDPNFIYNAPFQVELICYEESLAVEPGDVITLDGSLSEEFAGRQVEVLQVEERPDGSRKFNCLEYISGAFGDTALPRQATQAPVPGTGLTFPFGLTGAGALVVPLNQTIDAGNRYAPITGITLPSDDPYNSGFEIFPDGQDVADGWTRNYQTFGTGPTYARSNVPYTGNYAQNITGTASNYGGIGSRPIAVKPGLQYLARIRTHAAVNATCRFYLTIDWFSDNADLSVLGANWIGSSDGGGGAPSTGNGGSYWDVNGVSSSWTLYEATVTAPAGAKFARFRILNYAAATPGTLTLDTGGWALEQVVSTDSSAGSTVNPTTTSTSYSVIPEMSITKTTFGGKVRINAQMSLHVFNNLGSGIGGGYIAIFRDGSQLSPDLYLSSDSLNDNYPTTLVWTDDAPPSAGTHTWDIRWKAGASPAGCEILENDSRKIQVEEVT